MRKLNVHFTLKEEARTYCRMVNAAVREITPSAIVFADDSPMIPHVTLAMGELDETRVGIAEFIKHVEGMASLVRPIRFSTGHPYLEDVVHSYVFADLDGGQYFLDVRRKAIEGIQSGWLSDVGGSYGLQPPHLTLAHISEQRERVRLRLAEIPPGPVFVSGVIEISDVGRKGTCVNSLAVFSVGIREE